MSDKPSSQTFTLTKETKAQLSRLEQEIVDLGCRINFLRRHEQTQKSLAEILQIQELLNQKQTNYHLFLFKEVPPEFTGRLLMTPERLAYLIKIKQAQAQKAATAPRSIPSAKKPGSEKTLPVEQQKDKLIAEIAIIEAELSILAGENTETSEKNQTGINCNSAREK